jgi:hypothetical protein
VVSLIPGFDADDALRDTGNNGTATWVVLDAVSGNTCEVTVDSPTMQPGSKIKRIAVSAMVAGEYTLGDEIDGEPTYIWHQSALELWMLGFDHSTIVIPGERRTVFAQVVDGELPDSWSVRMRRLPRLPGGGGGGPSSGWDALVYRLFVTAIWVEKPIANVTSPTDEVDNTSFPLIDWDVTYDPDGGTINEAEVAILSGTTVVASATLKGTPPASQWRSPVRLANGSYSARVRVRQNPLSNWSSYDTQAFSVNVQAPAAPSSVVVTPESANGRMKVDVTGSNSPVTVHAIEIEREGFFEWVPLRDFGIEPVNARLVTWDYEAPIGADVKYRARMIHVYPGDTGGVASAWVESTPTHWDSANWWLKHPTQPSLNRQVAVRSEATNTRNGRVGVFPVLDRSDPLVVRDKRLLPSGEISFRTKTPIEEFDVTMLLESGSDLLLQAPLNHGWPDRWVSFADWTRERTIDPGGFPIAFQNLNWQQVARPEEPAIEEPEPDDDDPLPPDPHLTIPFTIDNSAVIE